MGKTISVIVPVYNVEKYLDQCIESIVRQTYNDLEIILVDDGSTDGSGKICDIWAEKDERIRVLHKDNGGLSDARNAGLDVCGGEYIAFADSDDRIEREMYEVMAAAIESESADICGCRVVSFNDKTGETNEIGSDSYIVGKPEEFFEMLYEDTKFPVSACSKLYRREIWNERRFPTGRVCEDAFVICELIDDVDRLVFVPENLYHYRIRSNSIMSSGFSHIRMDEEDAWRRNCDFVKDNYPQVYRAAYTFYLQKVMDLIHEIGADDKPEFKDEYEYLRRIIKNNVGFMLFRSSASLKNKVRFIVDLTRIQPLR